MDLRRLLVSEDRWYLMNEPWTKEDRGNEIGSYITDLLDSLFLFSRLGLGWIGYERGCCGRKLQSELFLKVY